MARWTQNVRTLQWLDHWVGGSLAFAIGSFRRRLARSRTTPSGPAWQRLLFVKLTEQGSTVLACDALRHAIARHGREQVHLLVFEENREIVDLLGLLPPENVLVIRTSSLGALLLSTWSVLREIRRRRIDACVDLEFLSNVSALLALASGARLRAGFAAGTRRRPDRSDLFTHRVNYNPHLHTSRAFTTLVASLDVWPADLPALRLSMFTSEPPPRFRTNAEEENSVRQKLAAVGVPARAPLVLLNANAGDLLPLRKWPSRNYVELARQILRARSDVCVILTGAPGEAEAIGELAELVDDPRCRSLAGQTTLRELITLYGLAEILVTNDSGPAHFAALTAIDVVVLFGPETPVRFASENDRTHVFWAGLACSPCVNALNQRQTSCRNNLCLQSITVDRVFLRVCQLLRDQKPALAHE